MAATPWARSSDARWIGHYETLKREASSAQPDLLLIGDSIFGRWPARLTRAAFPGRVVFNIGVDGDRTGNVLWRLAHGDLPPRMSPRDIVLLIGTNNMGSNGADETPMVIAGGIAAIVGVLAARFPPSRIVVMGILPRGPRDDIRRPILARANALIAACADGDAIRFVDAGEKFLAPDGTIPRGLLRDGVHPTARGYALIAQSLYPVLDGTPRSPLQAP
jgi:beta-glucosidase